VAKAGYLDDVRALAETYGPASILALGPEGPELFGAYAASHPQCRLVALAREEVLEGLGALGRFDFGYVSDVLEHLEPDVAGSVLARLRDLHTQRFFALVPMGAGWPGQRSLWEIEDLLAFGMRLLGRYPRDGKWLHLYGYDINDYKATPDWLNSRDWAHPELWDKWRW
jgi:hypothetical protein